MKRLYIMHGYGGNPAKNWFPWLKSELEKQGVEVTVPAMPNTETPKFSEWLPYLQSIVKNPDENTFFIGHSLGCITVLRYIESLSDGVKVGGTLLVAGFVSPIHFTELNSFFETPVQFEKIKKTVNKIIAISSDDDPHIPYEQAFELRDKLGAEFITIHNGQHLNEKAGYKEIELASDKVKEVMELFLEKAKEMIGEFN